MPSQQIAVFNINPEGALVIRLEDIPQDFKYASHSTVKENAVRTVKERLPADHKVVGVSNPLPSPNGLGGAYVFPVRIIKPIREYDVDIGPSVKSLRGLSL